MILVMTRPIAVREFRQSKRTLHQDGRILAKNGLYVKSVWKSVEMSPEMCFSGHLDSFSRADGLSRVRLVPSLRMNHEKHECAAKDETQYGLIEPLILLRTREAIQRDGIGSLGVDGLTEADLPVIPWSGSALHVKHVANELLRAQKGEIDYLAVRSPDGYPVSVGGVDYAKEPDGGYLWQLGTHPELRGLGVGTHLIREAERRIAKRGRPWARLEVETDNPRAKALYERLGYEVYGTATDSWMQLDKTGQEVLHVADVFQMRKRVKAE